MKKCNAFVILMCLAGILLSSQETPSQALGTDSLIVFFRPKRFTGSGLTPSIYIDGAQVARLDNGRYFAIHVPAGKHKVESSMKHLPLEFTTGPNERVYLEMVVLAGNWRGGGRLVPDPAIEAKEVIAKLKPLDAKWIVDKRVVFETQ